MQWLREWSAESAVVPIHRKLDKTYAISSNFMPLSLEWSKTHVLWSVISTALRRCRSRAPAGNSVMERRVAVRVPFGTIDWRLVALGVVVADVALLCGALLGGGVADRVESVFWLFGLSLSSSLLPEDLSASSGSSSIRVDSRLTGKSDAWIPGEEPRLALRCRLPAAPIIVGLSRR